MKKTALTDKGICDGGENIRVKKLDIIVETYCRLFRQHLDPVRCS